MKLKILILLMGGMAIITSTSAQEDFTFRNRLTDTIHITVENADISKHFLGDRMGIKYYRLQETYTHVEAGTVTSPAERTMIEKPTIYYSIKKLNNLYKSQLKKGTIDSLEATKQLGWCYDVAFSIFDQDTFEFEKALKNAKKPEAMAALYANVVLE